MREQPLQGRLWAYQPETHRCLCLLQPATERRLGDDAQTFFLAELAKPVVQIIEPVVTGRRRLDRRHELRHRVLVDEGPQRLVERDNDVVVGFRRYAVDLRRATVDRGRLDVSRAAVRARVVHHRRDGGRCGYAIVMNGSAANARNRGRSR